MNRDRHHPAHRALALLLCVAQLSSLLPRAALAQQIADPSAPGSQQATVLRAANGVPLIHITTPSAAGVSRNQWRQFDVGGDGVVLNNSRGDVATQLGGCPSPIRHRSTSRKPSARITTPRRARSRAGTR